MGFRLPEALQKPDDTPAIDLLLRYYGRPYLSAGCATGAYFDTWTAESDPTRFTAEDLVAVTFLSVQVPPMAALRLLRDRSEEFTVMLAALGPDRDLAHEAEPLADDWAGWTLMRELKTLPGVGTTIASKLLACKRPKLRPIWDTVVTAVTDTAARQWEPLRIALRADNHALHHRLSRLRDLAGLPESVTVLRVLDVIAWREGKDRRLA
ncbi:hypothetical protein Val02_85380 [Virgisporangium aliadipatigenens]|uniref:Uncharacterized protein n=1 Tax=Virgisporangium aliadipatigenens TaxID=741659 RepID=A0A8J3YW98_9ACTN|nr:DUF6308 family protein [Virgisporangium aliadipatigenens]GIJ51652.1 hypothetical protein Val02_85380 [Virgisporangium aliadipatigenens]